MKSRIILPIVLKWILITVLLITVILLKIKTDRMERLINSIAILDVKGDSLVARQITAQEDSLILLTPEFTKYFAGYTSPFKDGFDFRTLIAKYVRDITQDMYGAPRRTGEFKRIHEGIDLFVPENTPVYPLQNYGIVTEISNDEHYMLNSLSQENGVTDTVKIEYGKIVRIIYPEGIESLYAHLNEVYVKVGQVVDYNTKVALTGYTGNIKNSGKPSHLHLELRDRDNASFDPTQRLHYNKQDYNHFIKKLKFR